MMIGGVAYLYPFTLQDSRKKLVEWTGLALVVGSYFLISAENAWPGYLALFPVIGSFLIIQAQRNDSLITSNIIFQKIGAWSYSIYLWHWPFVVIIYTFTLPKHYAYLGMAFSILLGFLSYKYVEKIKFRNDFSSIFSYFKSKPLYIAGFVGILGSGLFIKPEATTNLRFTKEQALIVEQQKRDSREPVCGKIENGVSPGCLYGNGPVKAIVVGDSHAMAQMTAIGGRAEQANGSILDLGMNDCTTIKDLYINDRGGNADYNCGKLVSNAISISATEYPAIPIIIINRISLSLQGPNENDQSISKVPNRFVDKVYSERNDGYIYNLTNHMIDTICEFSKTNPVYLVRPTPELKELVPVTMFRSLTLNGTTKQVKITHDEYKQRQKTAYQMQDEAVRRCGAKILDPIPYLCDAEYCYGDIKGIPLYFDDDHLSSYGAEVIAPIYDEVFRQTVN
jgi:hypothetical protein